MSTMAKAKKNKAQESKLEEVAPAPSSPPQVTSRIQEHKRVPLAQLDPFKFGNPRKMDDRMRGVLQRSLQDFGVVEPIIVRRFGDRYEILNGHHRYAALQAMGAAEADVAVVDIPDDAKARALVVALNRISAEWDTSQLNAYVDQFLSDGGDGAWFADVTGFTAQEIDRLAQVGTEFLDDLTTAGEAPPAGEGAGGGAALPRTGDEQVTFAVTLTTQQNELLHAALAAAKKRGGLRTTADALVLVCQEFIGGTP